MSVIAKKTGKDFEPILAPAGTHHAVCHAVWDIGVQEQQWNGQIKKLHKCIISWELKETIENEGDFKGKRYVVSNRYTLSLHEKSNLRKHLESWRGKAFTDEELDGFDIEKLVGKNCLLTLTHKENGDRTYVNITGVSALMKDMEKIEPENGTEPFPWVIKLIEKGSPLEQAKDTFHAKEIGPENDEIPF